MPLGQIVVEILKEQYAMLGRPLIIAETGTMYVTELERGEIDLSARSTFAIARWIEETGKEHSFTSIDLDLGHIHACQEALGPLAENVTHILGRGTIGLCNLQALPDLVLLDADSDADSIADEFATIAPEMETCAGIVIIDDVFKPEKVNKGRKVLPALQKAGKIWFPLGGIAAGIPFGAKYEQLLYKVSKYAR